MKLYENGVTSGMLDCFLCVTCVLLLRRQASKMAHVPTSHCRLCGRTVHLLIGLRCVRFTLVELVLGVRYYRRTKNIHGKYVTAWSTPCSSGVSRVPPKPTIGLELQRVKRCLSVRAGTCHTKNVASALPVTTSNSSSRNTIPTTFAYEKPTCARG